LGLLRE